MTAARTRAVTAPVSTLATVAAAGAGLVGVVVVGLTCAVVVLWPDSGAIGAAAVVGALATAGCVLVAGRVGSTLGRRLDRVVHAATRSDTPGGATLPSFAVPVQELDELVTALSALQQRVRVSDDLAERQRRNAERASAGMFELLSGLVAAEEGTRGQLSAELHDTVAQSLGIARRSFEQARAEGVLPELLTDAYGQVEDAEEALRATMARTRPPALRDGDLAAAVTVLRDDLEFRYGLQVHLHWPDVEYPMPLATAVAVYRFFQEALLNVVKHADVDEAEARLEVDARYVVAVVSDAGPGFPALPPAAGRGGRHVGLGLLRERARLAGGRLDLQTDPGRGSTLTLRLPRPAMPLPAAGLVPSDLLPRQARGQDPVGLLLPTSGEN